MCGVFGYVGTEAEIGPDLLRALRTLEYRGYDSAGIAVINWKRITCLTHGLACPGLTA